MRWIYNILFSLLFWAATPWLLIRLRRRGPWRKGFGQRFGNYEPGMIPPKSPGGRRFWLHAVSVGEVNTCLQLLNQLQARMPDAELFVSSTTTTGMAELRAKLPANVTPIYFPIDRRKYVRRALDVVKPDAVILVEREIWPNFLWALEERSIPLCLINARISDRSHRSYKRYGFLFRQLYAQFTVAAAQTEMDAQRLREVGCRNEILHVVGSMKFDAIHAGPNANLSAPEILTWSGRKSGSPVLVAGSTHDGEEVLLARVAQRLRKEFPDLFLVLVPRHFERCSVIAEQLRAAGVTPLLRSTFKQDQPFTSSANQCLLVDSTGELTAFYAEADLVFVGKSLCATGGQNPIEPASLGKPAVFGPNMQNFLGVTQQLSSGQAAIQVSDETQLEQTIAKLLRSTKTRSEMGRNAMEIVHQNQGATRRTVNLIVDGLEARWAEARNL